MSLRTRSWVEAMVDLSKECFDAQDLELLQELFVSVLVQRTVELELSLEN